MMQVKNVFLWLIVNLILTSCNTRPEDGAPSATSGKEMPAATSPSSGNDGWLTNLNDAYAQSVRDRKPILAYFTASDTCNMCKQLEADVFSTPLFDSWSKENLVLFRIDIPSHSSSTGSGEDQRAAMARSLKVTTFPALWMLSVTHESENGRFKVKPIGYVEPQTSPERLIGAMQNFMRR